MCLSPRVFHGMGLLADREAAFGNTKFLERIGTAIVRICGRIGTQDLPSSDMALAVLVATCCESAPDDLVLAKLNKKIFTPKVLRHVAEVRAVQTAIVLTPQTECDLRNLLKLPNKLNMLALPVCSWAFLCSSTLPDAYVPRGPTQATKAKKRKQSSADCLDDVTILSSKPVPSKQLDLPPPYTAD